MQPFDFINAANADYIAQLEEQYRTDPRLVPETWRAFFAGFDLGLKRSDLAGEEGVERASPGSIGVFDLVHSYRELGHFCATLDPLGKARPDNPLLDLSNFGMSDSDLDRQVGQGGFLGQTDGTLRDLIEKLRATYCRNIGVEYTGIADKTQREWLQQRMEPILNRPEPSDAERRSTLFEISAAEDFEQYLGKTFVGAKRFSIEGAESLVPMLNTIIDEGAKIGGEQFIMSMAHRGRLSTLAHVLNKPYETILSEFMYTNVNPDNVTGDGDVKYHLGYANHRKVDGAEVKLSLVPNPSHLELVNPIQQGIVRAKQVIFGDTGRGRVVPICIHGDAAFTGQGIVAETLNLSELPGWRTGGTIHIIVNNQIGFTTAPTQGRFTPYPTDMAKGIQAPIFHVNGDDPEAVVWASKLAIAFRQQFKVDVIIDLWCYRRHGHNETDPADFTQPLMYKQIATQPTTRALYEKYLLEIGKFTQEEFDSMRATVRTRLDKARTLAEEIRPRLKVPSFAGVWNGLSRAGSDWSALTQLPADALNRVVGVLNTLPANFVPHPKLARIMAERVESVAKGVDIDWGTAEMLAFGSLLTEGHTVRLTGQDVERGTFSHRHAVLNDYNTGEKIWPLAQLTNSKNSSTAEVVAASMTSTSTTAMTSVAHANGDGTASANSTTDATFSDRPATEFIVMNSMLSEMAVLGFEWGYASADPRNLVLWEAQFGDFVNGAQPIIDQIIAAAESKWHYMNGLVMLLPHGYEGMGPEHSNAYLDRFLQLCAEENMQVAMPSTPAQYFHLLRRQIHRKFRKPLILMMPKALLRKKGALSELSEFTQLNFRNVIDDAANPGGMVREPDRVKRVLLCSGKVYYALAAARDQSPERLADTAIIRVEQLYPFPEKELTDLLAKYGRKQEVFWVQEEPRNRGAWTFIEPRVRALLPDTIFSYVGRPATASPATGSTKQHDRQEKAFIATALDVSPKSVPIAVPATSATGVQS